VKVSILLFALLAALVHFSAEGADITGEWTATIVTTAEQKDYTYVFRQIGAKLIGTARPQDGVVSISNGFVNNRTITFDENVTTNGRRVVFEYTGELVSDTEIRFERQAKGSPPVIRFVAIRIRAP
jgi:hypothetical protein